VNFRRSVIIAELYDGLKSQNLEILSAILFVFFKKRSLSHCRYYTDRAQNLPGPAPTFGSLFQISSKSVHFNFTFGRVIAERMKTVFAM